MSLFIEATLGLIAVENLNPSSPVNFATADFSRQNRDRRDVRVEPHRQSQLMRQENPTAAKTGTASPGWLHSTRNLDFCLLALCSCLLTILCHQVVVIPGSGTATGSIAATSSMPRSAQLDFLLKAGLFTSKSQPEVEAEEAL